MRAADRENARNIVPRGIKGQELVVQLAVFAKQHFPSFKAQRGPSRRLPFRGHAESRLKGRLREYYNTNHISPKKTKMPPLCSRKLGAFLGIYRLNEKQPGKPKARPGRKSRV